MKRSLFRFAFWITCISSYSSLKADHSIGRLNKRQIRGLEHEEPRAHPAAENLDSPRQQDASPSKASLEKRDIPLRFGLAANPNVLTQEVPPKERRSKIVHQPRAVADDDPDADSFHPHWHMGLAANPDVITQDLPSNSAPQRRRSLGELTSSSTEDPILRPAAAAPEANKDQINVAGAPALNLNTVGLGKSISLPLRRREISEDDKNLPPEIYFQKHLNHAIRRHAHFLNKSLDERVLENNLRRRAESVGWTFDESSGSARRLFPRQAKTESQGFPLAALNAAKADAITKANPVTAANSIGLDIEANDVGYFAEIQVGTPPTTFKFVADTGSADTWLQLPDCRNLKNAERGCNHPSLNPDSSTFKRSESPFQITYGTGKVVGVLIEETINMGGLILNNHVFGGVVRASDEFTRKNVPFDGLMGTAKSILSNQKVLTPIEALAEAGTLTGAFVGYALGRASDSENIGQLTIGGIDQTKFKGILRFSLTSTREVSGKVRWKYKSGGRQF